MTDDRVAIVTGGSTGIGLAAARALVDRGARVVLASRDRERGQRRAKALSEHGPASFLQTDVTDAKSVASLVEDTVDAFDRLDILVNAAGVEGAGKVPFTEWGEDDISQVLDTNVKGLAMVTQETLPHLLEDGPGAVVNVASFVGTAVPVPGAEIYGASKAAVVSMTRSLAAAYGEDGVRVHGVAPWITDTPMVDRLTGHDADAKAQLAGKNPSGGIVDPADVGEVIASIAVGQGQADPGETVLVDAGGETKPLG